MPSSVRGSDSFEVELVPCAGLKLRSAEDSWSEAESEKVTEPLSTWIDCALWEGESDSLSLGKLLIVSANSG